MGIQVQEQLRRDRDLRWVGLTAGGGGRTVRAAAVLRGVLPVHTALHIMGADLQAEVGREG